MSRSFDVKPALGHPLHDGRVAMREESARARLQRGDAAMSASSSWKSKMANFSAIRSLPLRRSDRPTVSSAFVYSASGSR
jgi:hypothetical protein